jgi:hypothetical protein
MGQAANSGRNASLDNKKQRAAGRQQSTPESEAIRDFGGADEHVKGRTGGAFGKSGMANEGGSEQGGSERIMSTRPGA